MGAWSCIYGHHKTVDDANIIRCFHAKFCYSSFQFKALVAAKFEAKEEQLCLIFAGKILKDGDTLAQHKITDGLTVHLVIKSQNRSQEQAATVSSSAPASSTESTASTLGQPNVANTPFGLGALGGLQGIGNMGMGSANFMEMQQRMQREVRRKQLDNSVKFYTCEPKHNLFA